MAKVTDTYGSGVVPASYVPSLSSDLNLIGKIAISIIRDVATKNPLSPFMKGKIDNGDTVEQAVVKLLESTSYDRDGENALTPDKTEKMAVRYFSNWTRKKFQTTIWATEMEKYLTGEISAESVIEKLVNALAQSDTQELYEGIKDMLYWGASAGSLGAGTAMTFLGDIALTAGGETDYKGILKMIKNTVKGMSYVNDDYNKAGIRRSTPKEDIYIVAPYDIITDIDVDSLAGVFNLDKAEIKSKIIEIDTNQPIIYILDRHAILVYTRLYQMLTQLNADGAFYNYFLHVERLLAISPLFDSAWFTYHKA